MRSNEQLVIFAKCVGILLYYTSYMIFIEGPSFLTVDSLLRLNYLSEQEIILVNLFILGDSFPHDYHTH